MMPDPYLQWRSTAVWDHLRHCLQSLERQGRLTFGSDGDALDRLTGEICSLLDGDGHLAGTRCAAVRAVLARDGLEMAERAPELCAMFGTGTDARRAAAYLATTPAEQAITAPMAGPPGTRVASLRDVAREHGWPDVTRLERAADRFGAAMDAGDAVVVRDAMEALLEEVRPLALGEADALVPLATDAAAAYAQSASAASGSIR